VHIKVSGYGLLLEYVKLVQITILQIPVILMAESTNIYGMEECRHAELTT
jgi:hypothetical protein